MLEALIAGNVLFAGLACAYWLLWRKWERIAKDGISLLEIACPELTAHRHAEARRVAQRTAALAKANAANKSRQAQKAQQG